MIYLCRKIRGKARMWGLKGAGKFVDGNGSSWTTCEKDIRLRASL